MSGKKPELPEDEDDLPTAADLRAVERMRAGFEKLDKMNAERQPPSTPEEHLREAMTEALIAGYSQFRERYNEAEARRHGNPPANPGAANASATTPAAANPGHSPGAQHAAPASPVPTAAPNLPPEPIAPPAPRAPAEYPEIMTIEQVAGYLQLHKQVVYRHIRDGTLPVSRIGRTARVKKSVLDAFLESGAWNSIGEFLKYQQAHGRAVPASAPKPGAPEKPPARRPRFSVDVD